MSRNAFSFALCLLLSLSAMAADSHTPPANTRDAVKAYVQEAAKVIAKDGPSCATFADKSWTSDDYYIIVVGPDDKVVCYPDPQVVGRPTSQVVDVNGKKVGDLLNAAARNNEGGGWVEYLWPRPGTTKPVPKSSYAVSVTAPDGKRYVVGSGGYELK
jgi:signal transduction histidine kinase